MNVAHARIPRSSPRHATHANQYACQLPDPSFWGPLTLCVYPVVAVVTSPMWTWLARRYGKKVTYYLVNLYGVAVFSALYFPVKGSGPVPPCVPGAYVVVVSVEQGNAGVGLSLCAFGVCVCVCVCWGLCRALSARSTLL